jgi:predicted nucleic acid-binding protein
MKSMLHEKINCFIDSNIWLYAFLEQNDTNKTALAKQLFGNSALNKFVSTQVINEVCFNLRKKAQFSETELQIIIDSFYQSCFVMRLEYTTLSLALELRQQYNLSFWDSLMVSSGLQANVEIFYSEDIQHNLIVNKTLKIVNPLL